MLTKGYIDLHIHTFNSDGYFSPTKIIDLSKTNNTNFIAISDHDTINGLNEFHRNLQPGMIGVDGVEFSSFTQLENKKVKLHILGYGFEKNNTELLKLLNEQKEKRLKSHKKLLEFLKQQLTELPEKSISQIDMERYCWFDREIIKCMEQEKYSPDIVEYYREYFKNNKFSYGKDYDLAANRVIDGIKSANGLVVLAHPMAYKLSREDIIKIIRKLTELGIDGVEVYQSDCSYEDSLYLNEMAKKYNLLCSVGSDFHRITNSDGRLIGRGINDNLCIEEISLTNKILEKKMYFKGDK